MSTSPWRYALASIEGTSHLRSGVQCQDACRFAVVADPGGDLALVAVVSDGAGSALASQAGARLACLEFVQDVTEHLLTGVTVRNLARGFAEEWLQRLNSRLDEAAAEASLTRRDFACTVSAAVVGAHEAVFFQVGDGTIVVSGRDEPEEFRCVFWPEKGEYENQTYFVTDPMAPKHLHTQLHEGACDDIALFTDGLQRLALRLGERVAHVPFFRGVFHPLVSELGGYSTFLSERLGDFLSSDQINKRTDDDKTLVIATRRPFSDRFIESRVSNDDANETEGR